MITGHREKAFSVEQYEELRRRFEEARASGRLVEEADLAVGIAELTGWKLDYLQRKLGAQAYHVALYRKVAGMDGDARSVLSAMRLTVRGAAFVAGLSAELQAPFLRHLRGLGRSLLRGFHYEGEFARWRREWIEEQHERLVGVGESGEAVAVEARDPVVKSGRCFAPRVDSVDGVDEVSGVDERLVAWLEVIESGLRGMRGIPAVELEGMLGHWADEERVRHRVGAVIMEAELVLGLCNYVSEGRETRAAVGRMVGA